MWKAGFYKKHEQLAEVFRKGELTRNAIYSLHDSSGNNLAHKIFEYFKEATKKNLADPRAVIGNYLYAIEKLHELCGDDIFEIENKTGKTPFSASPLNFREISERVDYRIAPSLFSFISKQQFDDLWKQGDYRDHANLRKFFEEGFIDESAIYAKKGNNEENLAHKILKNLKRAYLNYQIKIGDGETPDSQEIVDYLYALGRLYEVCGNDIFEQQNKEREIPFVAYSSGNFPIKFSELFTQIGLRQFHPNLVHLLIRNYEVLLNTDPDFFLIPLQNNATPLMYFALDNPEIYPGVTRKLTTLGKPIDQKDRWGYTAKQWIGKKALGANYLFALDNLNHDLSSEPLDISFWDKVERESIYDFTDQNNQYFFDELAFNEVLLNQDRTGLKESFLQRNITTLQNEANQLWEAFFKAHDDLVVKRISRVHGGDNGYIDRIKGTPNAIRVLGRISSIEDYLCYPEGRETAQIIRSKILSTGGTFGINFKRTATSNEAKTMKDSVESFVRNVESNIWSDIAQEIMNAFFVAYSLPLEKTQQDALDSHQVNCVILGLYSAFNIHQRYSPEDPFSEIDRLVAAKKGCSASAIRSKDRYDGIAEHIGS